MNTFQKGEWIDGEWHPADDREELPPFPRKEIPKADRELLELAGRALGAVRFEEVDGEGYGVLHFADGTTRFHWNPLDFSDDTFDLVVDLRITLCSDRSGTNQATAYRADIGWVEERHELHEDAKAATRRVAVRAAAEIAVALMKK